MARRRSVVRLLAALAALGLALAAVLLLDVQPILRAALARVEELGPLGAAAFVGIYVVACVLLVPGSVLTLGAGAVYGVVRGSLLVSLASTLGATAAFLAGRYLARDWVARRLEGNERFRAIDEAVGREGWKIVGLTRLSPVFPFNLLNYAYGLTRVSLRDYVLASWAGMIPGTVLFVYLGSLAGSVADLDAPGGGRSPAEWTLYLVGLAATLAVTVYVTRIARAALAKRI